MRVTLALGAAEAATSCPGLVARARSLNSDLEWSVASTFSSKRNGVQPTQPPTKVFVPQKLSIVVDDPFRGHVVIIKVRNSFPNERGGKGLRPISSGNGQYRN